MSAPFLSARWVNLIIASYAVEPALLAPRVPAGLSLDTREGRAFVSLVAFSFLDTRVQGVPWPGHRHFPELNLRFYVRRAGAGAPRRGVMFVREYVPRRAIATVARRCYNEPYACAPMTMSAIGGWGEPAIEARYTIRRGGREMTLGTGAEGPPSVPDADSLEHWFKEHEWGYGVDRAGRVLEYAVQHPVWRTRSVRSLAIDIDWAALYGPEWSGLQGVEPESVVFAEGSAVTVLRPTRL